MTRSVRTVEDCPYRVPVDDAIKGRAACQLVDQWLGGPGTSPPVALETCARCCRSAPPGPGRPNGVIASIVYRQLEREFRQPGVRAAGTTETEWLRQVLARYLDVDWSAPNHSGWRGDVANLASVAELHDPDFTPETLARHLERREPFTYVRYGDGEWLSILGLVGRNCDGHDFLPDTLGRELAESLDYFGGAWTDESHVYTGLNAVAFQEPVRRYLVEHGIAWTAPAVSDSSFTSGWFPRSTLRFIRALKSFSGTKVLVGPGHLRPVAGALGCRHVIAPSTDCYLDLDRMERECRAAGPALVTVCASMASECLVYRLHRDRPRASYVDCGHIFDPFVGVYSRDYLRDNGGNILGLLREHYVPAIFGASTELGPST